MQALQVASQPLCLADRFPQCFEPHLVGALCFPAGQAAKVLEHFLPALLHLLALLGKLLGQQLLLFAHLLPPSAADLRLVQKRFQLRSRVVRSVKAVLLEDVLLNLPDILRNPADKVKRVPTKPHAHAEAQQSRNDAQHLPIECAPDQQEQPQHTQQNRDWENPAAFGWTGAVSLFFQLAVKPQIPFQLFRVGLRQRLQMGSKHLLLGVQAAQLLAQLAQSSVPLHHPIKLFQILPLCAGNFQRAVEGFQLPGPLFHLRDGPAVFFQRPADLRPRPKTVQCLFDLR